MAKKRPLSAVTEESAVSAIPEAIEMKYADILASSLMNTIARINQEVKLHPKWALKFGRLFQKLAPIHQSAHQGRTELLKKFALLDDKGNFQPGPNGREIAFKAETSQAEAERELETYLQTTFRVHQKKIPVDALMHCGLSPDELLSLEPVLSGLEALEEDT